MILDATRDRSQQTDGLTKAGVALEVPGHISRAPAFCHLTKRYRRASDILEAKIEDVKPHLVLELRERAPNRHCALRFLAEIGARIATFRQGISVDKSKCTECGACIGVCPTNCFYADPDTFEIRFEGSNCVGCCECARICPTRAISMEFVLASGWPLGGIRNANLKEFSGSQAGRLRPRGKGSSCTGDREAVPQTFAVEPQRV